MIEFTIPGDAVPWARAGKRGPHTGAPNKIAFTPAKQRSYAGTIKLFCQNAMRGAPAIEGPIELSVVATYIWPKSMSPKKRQLPGAQWKTSRPDYDNLGKIVCDALNTVAWRDDAQVVAGFVWKRYGELASLAVRIRRLDGG
jgi:Holliday junction resolvase RusA-like endonuclease